MILLDTHVLIWADLDPRRLGVRARRRVELAVRRDEVALPSIAFFEAGLLVERGRLSLEDTLRAWRAKLLERGLHELPISGDVAARATEVGLADPFDRLIVAVAIEGGCTLVTADESILDWKGELRRVDARE